MLKIQFKDRRKPALWLVDSTLKLGSDPACDIVVDDALVDAIHAEVETSQDEILVRNVSKQKSVFVNEFPVVGEHALTAWDVVRLGGCELEIIDPLKERTPQPVKKAPEEATVVRPSISPWMLKGISAPLDGQYFSLSDGNVIGREKGVEIVVPLSYVSRRHAIITLQEEKLFIEDLGSSNGTFINGERVKSCELRNGDEIRFDQFVFKVVGPAVKRASKPRTVVRQDKPKTEAKANSKSQSIDKPELASKPVFFHGISAELRGKVFEITQTQNHISRMLGHHLSTSEKSVSARHVYLTETSLGWEIKNDGAADGLMINGKMQSRVLLQDGDELTVGGTLLKFQSVGDQPLNYNKITQDEGSSATKVIIGSVVLVLVAVALYFSDVLSL